MPEPRIQSGKLKVKPEALAARLRARTESAGLPGEVVIVAEAAPGLSCSSLAMPEPHSPDGYGVCLSESSGLCQVKSSSCGDGEGCVSDMARPSPDAEGPAELLHELANLMTTVLLNAQMLEWKLPPYSHLKRPVREVARNAQRATELMRRLQQHTAHASGAARSTDPLPTAITEDRPAWSSSLAAAPNAALEAAAEKTAGHIRKLTARCDPRTSNIFPKRDDSGGH